MESDEEVEINSPMKDYFNGKVVFLTGGTGFLGQLYVEKLLRSGVKQIYLLGRAKKNKTAQERLQETFVGPQFSKLIRHDKNFLSRLTLIEGDINKLSIGISESDENLLIENVNIVLHAAANVKFDEKLYKLLMDNLRGTREILKLAEKIKKLEVFAYISTAYSHCVRSHVDEKFYPSPVDPDVMIKLGETSIGNNRMMDQIDILTDRIIRPWPNTYAYTKALSEELVRRFGSKFPICIIRPSIVISTHEDPIPGWCNNIYGLNGVIVAGGMGVLRMVPLREEAIGDIVCADYVINSTLAVMWTTYEDTKDKTKISALNENLLNDPKIYHVCTSTDQPTLWGQITKGMYITGCEYPPMNMLWKPTSSSSTCPFMWRYLTIFYHIIPAITTDVVLSLCGKKMRVLPIYRKVQRFMEALKYFMLNEWIFSTKNMREVLNRMSAFDREFFPSDVKRWKWSTFQYEYSQGLKVYLAHENLDDAEKARRRLKIFSILHFLVLIIFYSFHIMLFIWVAKLLGFYNYIRYSV